MTKLDKQIEEMNSNNEKKVNLMLAFKNGKIIEQRTLVGKHTREWKVNLNPNWDFHTLEFRVREGEVQVVEKIVDYFERYDMRKDVFIHRKNKEIKITFNSEDFNQLLNALDDGYGISAKLLLSKDERIRERKKKEVDNEDTLDNFIYEKSRKKGKDKKRRHFITKEDVLEVKKAYMNDKELRLVDIAKLTKFSATSIGKILRGEYDDKIHEQK